MDTYFAGPILTEKIREERARREKGRTQGPRLQSSRETPFAVPVFRRIFPGRGGAGRISVIGQKLNDNGRSNQTMGKSGRKAHKQCDLLGT